MAATGNPIGAKEAYEIGLVDRLIEGDLEQHAVAFAEEVRDVRPIPKTSERDDKLAEARANPGIFDDFRKANARKFRGFDAPEVQHPRDRGGGRQALCRGRPGPSGSCSWS